MNFCKQYDTDGDDRQNCEMAEKKQLACSRRSVDMLTKPEAHNQHSQRSKEFPATTSQCEACE